MITKPATVAVASSPVSLRRARPRRRPQRPGNQFALSRVIWMFPPAIRSRESPAAAGSAAIIGRVRNSHVSLNPLSVTLSRRAIQKTPLIVQKLWTLRLPCGSRRKSKQELHLPARFSTTYTPSHNFEVRHSRSRRCGDGTCGDGCLRPSCDGEAKRPRYERRFVRDWGHPVRGILYPDGPLGLYPIDKTIPDSKYSLGQRSSRSFPLPQGPRTIKAKEIGAFT
jgi:hypothetical protein